MLRKNDSLHPVHGFIQQPGLQEREERAGLDFESLPVGAVVEIETKHHNYCIEKCDDNKAVMSGHPQYCPKPVLVELYGTTSGWDLKVGVIEPGTKLIFRHPDFGVVTTSRIVSCHELQTAGRLS